MKLVKLSVARFQCIESAEVTFGPGLNVLYGPNDLGKTSLAWAIRAALLLQHNSAAHERFVSWQGGGEPRVVLTLTDDDNRFWRITKAFGSGSAGRSSLESSKDGRTFVSEASARGVDEKIRGLLDWGIHKPGGRGGPQGLPQSFITQVLLADQDDVRKILFQTSLADDADESGRKRLAEALGALAQDPQFKAILDRAQAQVDRAFTPQGRQSRKAGSPFVEIKDRIVDLQRQRDELVAKVRESELAEANVARLNVERDSALAALDEARTVHVKLTAALAAQARRDALTDEIRSGGARIERASMLASELEASQRDVDLREADLVALATNVEAQRERLAALEPERSERRAELDGLLRASADDPTLLARKREASDGAMRADRAVEEATRALDQAKVIAKNVEEHAAKLLAAVHTSQECDEVVRNARVDEQLAGRALDVGKQKLRDLTSGDQAQTRELRQKELENRLLELGAERTALATTLERVATIERLEQVVCDAEARRQNRATQLSQQHEHVKQAAAEVARIDHELATLARVLRYAELHAARAQLDGARVAEQAAAREREAAARLRAEADRLRQTIRPNVPEQAVIDALLKLRTDLQVAEARLGAMSVSIRPMRPLRVTVARDGVAEPAREVREPTTLTAAGAVVVAIDGVAELEVSTGDGDARAAASGLRARWQRDGSEVLQACRVETVEQLAQLRRDTDRTLTTIADHERDATRADEAANRGQPKDIDELLRQVTELEAELGADRDGLAVAHAALGANPKQTASSRMAKLQADLAASASKHQEQRELAVRAEAELAGAVAALETSRRDLETQRAAVGDNWQATRDSARTESLRVDREHGVTERALGELATARGRGETEAREAVDAAEEAVVKARAAMEVAERAAREARDAEVTARATLAASHERAVSLDARGAWRQALSQDSPKLDADAWQREVVAATAERDHWQHEVTAIEAQLEAKAREHRAKIDGAQQVLDSLEGTAAALRKEIDALIEGEREDREELDRVRKEVSDIRIELAGIDVAGLQARLAVIEPEVVALPAANTRYEPAQVELVEARLTELANKVRGLEDELARARGGLEQVGGAVVREQLHDLDQALQQAHQQQRQIEIEYGAWQLLVEALRNAESKESQHLGRQLAGPVSQRFQQLTNGRYGALQLDAHLGTEGFHAAGDLRAIDALSAGTQDQLATLFRLCVAQQLRSAIVLDDHLSQSDPGRVSWFNDAMRAAAQDLQIIFITCRPQELLFPDEVPAPGEAVRVAAAGLTHAVDLTRVIRRLA